MCWKASETVVGWCHKSSNPFEGEDCLPQGSTVAARMIRRKPWESLGVHHLLNQSSFVHLYKSKIPPYFWLILHAPISIETPFYIRYHPTNRPIAISGPFHWPISSSPSQCQAQSHRVCQSASDRWSRPASTQPDMFWSTWIMWS